MRKHKKKELNVDFIGGQGSLTKKEEKAISEYLENQKSLRGKQVVRRKKTASQKNVTP